METIGFRFKNFSPLLVGSILIACSGRQMSYEGIPLLECKPNSITVEVSELSSYISELEVFPLAKDTIAFKGVAKLLISDRHIVLSGGVVFSISTEGDNLMKIGNVGRGPGEYLSIKDIALSPDGKELWCLELYNSVLRYNSTDGIFLGKVDVPMAIGYAKGVIPMSPTVFALYIPNPTSGHCLKFFDINGNETGHAMPYCKYNFDMGFSIPVTVTDGRVYAVSPESKTPTVVYCDGIPKRQHLFDFDKKNVPDAYYSLNQEDPWNVLGELFEQDYYKQVSSVFFPKGDFCFRAFGKESSSWNYYINKEFTKGIRWPSVGVFTPPICPIASDDGYVYFPYEDYGYLSLEEEKDALKRLVIQQYGLPEHTGATYVIKAKFDVENVR